MFNKATVAIVSSSLRGWSLIRTVVACGGALVAATTLGSACLDYAGEDYGAELCPVDQPDAGSTSSGSEAEAEPDCAEAAPPGDGSGSGSGAMQ